MEGSTYPLRHHPTHAPASRIGESNTQMEDRRSKRKKEGKKKQQGTWKTKNKMKKLYTHQVPAQDIAQHKTFQLPSGKSTT